MRPSPVGFFLALGSLLILDPSCNDDNGSRPCDWNHLGAIHGYVLAAGQPPAYPAFVRLASTDDPYSPLVEASAATDSTGWYEFIVPEGTYVLQVRIGGQEGYYARPGLLRPRTAPCDTLTVSCVPLRADVHLGAVTFDLTTPSILDGQSMRVELVPTDGDSLPNGYAYGDATAHDGRWSPGPMPVAPGSYRLRLKTSDQTFWLPGTLDPTQAAWLQVGSGAPTSYSATVNAPWILAGEIKGPWQSLGLSSPHLTAYTDESSAYTSGRLAEGGSFRMTLFLQVPVRLLLHDSYPWRWIGGTDFASATEFAGAQGESVAVPPCFYSALECHVEPPDPYWQADLMLLDASGHSVLPAEFRPPRKTPLTIPCLDPGTYFLKLAPRGAGQRWCPQWFDQADQFEDALPIEVPPVGGTARITMVLSTCGTISGRLLRADGSPAGGRRVELCAADDPLHGVEYSPIYTVTDRDTGEFSLGQLHDGTYRLGVRYTLTTLVWYPGTLLWDEAEVLTLVDHGQITGLEWSLVE